MIVIITQYAGIVYNNKINWALIENLRENNRLYRLLCIVYPDDRGNVTMKISQ